jgi:hypothetical protein
MGGAPALAAMSPVGTRRSAHWSTHAYTLRIVCSTSAAVAGGELRLRPVTTSASRGAQAASVSWPDLQGP